jgi:hypothetical protein
MVLVETADTTSSMVAAPQPQGVIVSAGDGTSPITIDAYAVLVNSADAVSTADTTTVISDLLLDSASGVSSAVQVLNQVAEAAANATDKVLVADALQLLVSAAQAISNISDIGTVAGAFVESSGNAKSFASLGLLEAVTSSANATGLIAVLQRRVDVDATSTAAATSSADPNGVPETYLLISTADGTSLMQVQNDAVLSISSSAEVTSDVWFEDPSSKAWVMNTETTAMGWYDNFKFESIVSWKGRELAVGPDGIHELTGASDNGRKIDSLVESGFTDFGAAQTKRLDSMYFGYTSDGQIAVKTEVYESGSPPYTYSLEKRNANAPRNSRVTPGKGLWGRYWRLTITNVDGADFEVHDATVDIAMSTRRI